MTANSKFLMSMLIATACSTAFGANSSAPAATGKTLTTTQKLSAMALTLATDTSGTLINTGEQALQKANIYETFHTFGSYDAQAGLVSFVPVEYWTSNPDDPTHPWLRIDVYRLGLGGRARDIFNVWATLNNKSLGPITITEGQPELKLDLNYVQDIMVVHPSSTPPLENIKHLVLMNINVIKEFKMVVQGLTQKLIDDPTFESGDMLITNATISAGPTYDTNPGILAFGPGASAGVTFARTHQISVLKLGDNQVVAQWGNIHDLNLNLEAGLRLFLFSAPVLGFEQDFTRETEHGYGFDLNDPGQKSSLLANLHTSNPVFSTPPTPVTDKKIYDQLSTFLVSALGFKTWSHSILKHHEVDYGPSGADQELYEKVATSRKRAFWLRSYLLNDQNITTAKVLKSDLNKKGLTSEDQINLTFEFKYDKKYATIGDYNKLYNNVVMLMPRAMMGLRPDPSKPALGHLTFNGSLQFTSGSISEIFSKHLSREQICEVFVNTLPVSVSDTDGQSWPASKFCQTFIPRLKPAPQGQYVDDRPLMAGEALTEVSVLRISPSDKTTDIATAISETDSFITAFDHAQSAIEKARKGGNFTSAANAVEGLGSGTSLLKMRVEALQSLVKSGEVVREATLQSEGEFTNHPGTIVMVAEDQNGNSAQEESLGLAKTAVETVLGKVRHYFYDQFHQETPRIGVQDLGRHDATF